MTEPDREYLLTSLDALEDAGHRQAAEWFRLIVLAGIRVPIPGGVCEMDGCENPQEMAVYATSERGQWRVRLLCRETFSASDEILAVCQNCGCFSPVN